MLNYEKVYKTSGNEISTELTSKNFWRLGEASASEAVLKAGSSMCEDKS